MFVRWRMGERLCERVWRMSVGDVAGLLRRVHGQRSPRSQDVLFGRPVALPCVTPEVG